MSKSHGCSCGHSTTADDEENTTCNCGGNCSCTPSADTVKQIAEEQATDD